jgi:hypothetical protein
MLELLSRLNFRSPFMDIRSFVEKEPRPLKSHEADLYRACVLSERLYGAGTDVTEPLSI